MTEHFDDRLDDLAKQLFGHLETELTTAFQRLKEYARHETKDAYKAGRAIIAEETVDWLGQKLSSLKTTSSEVSGADSLSISIFKKYRQTLPVDEQQLRNYDRLLDYLEENEEQTRAEVKALVRLVNAILEYVTTIRKITRVPE